MPVTKTESGHTASCLRCSWSWEISGATYEEAERALNDHMNEAHPKTRTERIVVVHRERSRPGPFESLNPFEWEW